MIEAFEAIVDEARRRVIGGPVAAQIENKVWYLRQNRLFADAVDSGIESSAHLFTMTVFLRRTRVFDQGDPSRVIYLVKTGKVRLARTTPDGKDVTVALLGPGDVFGEETLFSDSPRTTNAIVLEDALVCMAKADDLMGLLTRDPIMALNVAKILERRLIDASATMEDLAYAKIADRLMHLFRRLADEHGVRGEDGAIAIDLRLTHADIASLVGSTRETVSLELANLIRAGRLRSDEHLFTLPAGECVSS